MIERVHVIQPRLIKSVDATGEQWKLYELNLPSSNVCLILEYKVNEYEIIGWEKE